MSEMTMIRKISTYFAMSILGVSLFAFVPTLSYAIPITSTSASGICDPDGTGQCSKTVTLSSDNTILSIFIRNELSSQSIITADAFDLAAGVTVTPTSLGNFGLATGPISVSPFGFRQFAITTSPTAQNPWLGSGNPNAGLSSGQSTTWVLGLSGNVGGLTATDILNSQLVRFRGGLDSDKDPIGTIPEPSTMLLWGTGLAGLAAWRWKRGKRI
jgi:hypothetical protein